MTTHDLFGDQADEYARIRPTYPEGLFDHLQGLVSGHALAWDCGAGSGQTARSLARRFARVVATDSSLRQLAQAYSEDNVDLVAATAEAAPLRDRSADLVTVSAAVHWFDRPRFYEEVQRVARRGGILAVWSYYRSETEPAVDEILMRFAEGALGPYWNPGILLNRHAYRDLDFPFERLAWPRLHAETRMQLGDLLQYVTTWSASQEWVRSRGTNPLDLVRDELARAWGDPERERLVRWPLHGAIGRIG